MEAEEVFASMDSLWFHSSVFLLQPFSKHKQSKCPDEHSSSFKPKQQQGSAETQEMRSESSCRAPRRACAKEVMVVATKRRGASRSCRESDERVHVWLKQRRSTKAVAMPARCSPVPMPVPPPDDGIAMKAHLRSWAYAVACSVR